MEQTQEVNSVMVGDGVIPLGITPAKFSIDPPAAFTTTVTVGKPKKKKAAAKKTSSGATVRPELVRYWVQTQKGNTPQPAYMLKDLYLYFGYKNNNASWHRVLGSLSGVAHLCTRLWSATDAFGLETHPAPRRFVLVPGLQALAKSSTLHGKGLLALVSSLRSAKGVAQVGTAPKKSPGAKTVTTVPDTKSGYLARISMKFSGKEILDLLHGDRKKIQRAVLEKTIEAMTAPNLDGKPREGLRSFALRLIEEAAK